MTLPHPVRVVAALLAGGGLAATLVGAPVAAADPRADQERVETEAAEAAAAGLEHATDQTRQAAARYAAAEAALPAARATVADARGELVAARAYVDATSRQAEQGLAGNAPPVSGGAVLEMPTQGWVSSPYGMRQDPFHGALRVHAGTDLAAAGGAPIRAAADGTVIRAGWSGGYGNLTCLNHGPHQGRGCSTCYAHQSKILVASGQQVQRGELIGRVGTTGWSTGCHLHFEVRLDGEPTDPVPYLPACLC